MKKINYVRIAFFCLTATIHMGYTSAWAGICTFPAANSVDCQMTNGARWEFNWANDAKKGFVLNKVTLTAKSGAPRTLILEQASLAEVLVAYDNSTDSSQNIHHLNTGLPLSPLADNADCPLTTGTSRLTDGGGGPTLLCLQLQSRGFAWIGIGKLQGEQLAVFGVSAVGNDTYIHQWVFSDDGSIQPMLGVSGQLDPVRDSASATGWPIGPSAATRYATNRFHTAFWRLDFALGGQDNDAFQQLEYLATSTVNVINQSTTNINTENKFAISPVNQRFWLVKDTLISNAVNGQKIAFEIIPAHNAAVHRGNDPITNADIYITQNKTCEQFATANPSAPTPCAAGLTQFLNGETLTDPVAWVGTTWHQVPRAEDEGNVQTHWQGFVLAPRDLTATSPFN